LPLGLPKAVSDKTILSPVPTYDDLVARCKITVLSKSGDLTVRDGDFAVTRWGDLMLNDADYSAFFKLVQGWRYNYPTLKVMFEATFDTFDDEERLDADLQHLFQEAASRARHPTQALDHEAYHRITERKGATEVARGIYAGAIVVILSRMLQSFAANIGAQRDEWMVSGPSFERYSLGMILEASANNVRHGDEWAVTRPPNAQQLKSITILAAVLRESMLPDGSNHRLSREVSPEILSLITGRKFDLLEQRFFEFANALMARRQERLPIQD
jgi:hypothetical protein